MLQPKGYTHHKVTARPGSTPTVIPSKAAHGSLEDHSDLRRNSLQRLADPTRSPHRSGHTRPGPPSHHRRNRPAAGLWPHRHRRPRPRPGRHVLSHRSHPINKPSSRAQPRPSTQHPRPLRRTSPRRLPRPSQRPSQNLRVPHTPLQLGRLGRPYLLPHARPLRLGVSSSSRTCPTPTSRRPHPRHSRLHFLRRGRSRPHHPNQISIRTFSG